MNIKNHPLLLPLGIAVVALFSACNTESNDGERAGDEMTIYESDSLIESVQTEQVSTVSSEKPETAKEAAAKAKTQNFPVGVRALLEAYPDQIVDFKDGNLVFSDGTTLLYDDGKEKDFEYMLDNSTPKDMFYKPYPKQLGTPEYLADAGRSRSEPLFKKMYGSSSSDVQKKLVSVPWFGGSVKFTSVNGANKQLEKVYNELKKHPEFEKYLKSSGTFYWRNVRGAKRLSAHSYGIAFDIGVDNSDYWLWKNKNAKETDKIAYENRIPVEIAKIFEKYGFIWGGGWYHYDTMHFEYRPEILKYRDLS